MEELDLRGGTYPVGNVYFGKVSAATYAGDLYVDTVEVHSGADYTGQFIGPAIAPAQPSPVKAWRNGQYVDCDIYGWDGSEYIPVDVAHVLG